MKLYFFIEISSYFFYRAFQVESSLESCYQILNVEKFIILMITGFSTIT